MTTDHSARDITDGFPDNALARLTDQERDVVVYLLARASERAYRRGFQQGETIGANRPQDIRDDLHAWRYATSTDDSPWADGPRIEPATDRLFTENRRLRRLGLREPIGECIAGGLRSDETYRSRGGTVRGIGTHER